MRACIATTAEQVRVLDGLIRHIISDDQNMPANSNDHVQQEIKQAWLPTKSRTDSHKHEGNGQTAATLAAASTLVSGILAISVSQIMGAPLRLLDSKTYRAYTAWTKENFAILMTAITEWWAPTVVRVSGDESMQGQLYQMRDGSLRCNFPHRIILMANHQLYTDWLYVWWIAYTNKMHGHIYMVLKESLKQVPIIGWGMQLFNFIFLSRRWENDRFTFKQHLGRLRNNEPAWLIIFPEGTNLAQVTRDKSAAWSQKTGIPDMKHQLLPRTTGLRYCLEQLQSSMNWLYDATIAYEGVPKGGYGQDVFTLKSSFLEGQPPKSVNIFWRRFKIADIPYHNPEAFERWVINRWREKDYMLEYFDRFGCFPAGDALQALVTAKDSRMLRHARLIATEVKGGGLDEFLGIFGPVTTAAGSISAIEATKLLNFGQLIQQMLLPSELKIPNSEILKSVRDKQNSIIRGRPRNVLVRLEKGEGQNATATLVNTYKASSSLRKGTMPASQSTSVAASTQNIRRRSMGTSSPRSKFTTPSVHSK